MNSKWHTRVVGWHVFPDRWWRDPEKTQARAAQAAAAAECAPSGAATASRTSRVVAWLRTKVTPPAAQAKALALL